MEAMELTKLLTRLPMLAQYLHSHIFCVIPLRGVSLLMISLPGHFKCPEQSDAPEDRHAQRWHDLLAHQNKLQDGTYHNYEIKSENNHRYSEDPAKRGQV